MQENQEMDLTIEEAFAKLDQTVSRLEKEEVALEESFRLYKEGMDLLKYCNEKIDRIEKKMLVLQEDGTDSEF